jgi:PAS domain S-box-containing protein
MSIPKRTYKALVIGELWEADELFSRDVFSDTYPVEAVHVGEAGHVGEASKAGEAAQFREAIQDPSIDMILIDVDPFGLDVLDIVLETSPMRPAVLMVGNADQVDAIIEAKNKGLHRYVIRLDNDQINVDLLCNEMGSIFKEIVQQRKHTFLSHVDIVPLPIAVVHEDLSIEHVNPAFLELLGFDHADQIEGHPIHKFIHADDHQDVSSAVAQLISGARSYFRAEHRYCNEQGLVVWVNHIGFTIDEPNHDNGPPRALLIAVDITRQKEAEQRAEQSMRMEAIGELAGGVAHDFNNVLAIVSAIGHVLKAKLNENDQDQLVDQVEKILTAADSGSTLTDQLLGFSRNEKIEQELVDLNHRIREVCKLLEGTGTQSIDLRLDLEPQLPQIPLGTGQIDQVIMNLSVNARDAMPDGGPLDIRTYQGTVNAAHGPAPTVMEPTDRVVFEVQDSGIGMDRGTQKRVFEPFFTTKSPGEGIGMGLATVYRIVEAAGGSISVDSQSGKGTTFRLSFPPVHRSEQVPHSEQGQPANDTDKPPGGAVEPQSSCILIVEDEDNIRQPYRLFLEHAGYTVIDAANIEQAHAAVEAADGAIDVLLADVILPDGSGVDLARQLKARFDELELIFMSGYAPDLIYRDQEELAGRWVFLAKPVTREKLLSSVRDALERASSS